PALIDGIERAFGFRAPTHHGHDAVGAMEAMVDGRSRVLICLGGNLSIALPDPVACAAGMRKLDLAVHLNTKLNRSHLLIGKESIILPVLGRTEKDIQKGGAQSVTIEDSMSMVHASRGKLPPASEHLRSEPAIVAGMAAATLSQTRVDWMHLVEDYDRIRDKIEIVFPDFHDYNVRIRKPGGFRLPIGPAERVWNTPSGKAEFVLLEGVEVDPVADAPDILKLATIRSHDQYNTTIYGLDDRYRGVFGRRDVLFMHKQDLADRGLEHGDLVWVEPAVADGASRALKLTVLAYDIARGSVAAYYPEANGLVPLSYRDRASGTPSYKSVPVLVRKSD
ncbi:MAG: CbbBc protein, partial [Caulobacteraceae bacterium]|nr:CbbBc protein [Caulobacteraceae bacterium]